MSRASPRSPAFPRALGASFERRAEAARQGAESPLRRESARVRLAHGIACDVEHADRSQRVDLPASEGGGATGPHPGQLLRASLGASLVMGYRLWGARLDVPLDDVALDVTCDYDVRGQLGVEPAAAVGWTRVVFDVVLTSSADEGDVRRVVEIAHRTSPMLANLSPAVERIFHVRVVPSAPGA